MDEDEKIRTNRFRMKAQLAYESDGSDQEEPVKLDLGIDPSRNFEKISESEHPVAGPSSVDVHRREENPFSFKHFLRNNPTNYQSQGARPKVYCDGRPITSISDLELNHSPGIKQTRLVPEFPSVLPDFVQDHLVLEQCLLDTNSTSENGFTKSGNNLPDFTPHRDSAAYKRVNGATSRNTGRRTECDSNDLTLPLDLPARSIIGFPLDLPINDNHSVGTRSCPASTEVGGSKSLPDFLTDGAVRSQAIDDIFPGPSDISEVDRLKHSVELYRQQLSDQIRYTEQLRRQLEVAKNKELDYTHNLTKAVEQVEENLEQSNQRAAAAEDTIIQLKQEIRSLKSKTRLLHNENERLQRDHGAAGGPSISQVQDIQTLKVAQDLRLAASSAEQSLKQLLSGVENLRLIASSIENMNRIEEKTDDSSDIEDSTGPAL